MGRVVGNNAKANNLMIHTLGTFTVGFGMEQSILEVLKSGWLSPGPKVREFEEKFSALHGNKYGVMVNSGTDALRIAFLALKEKYGWKDGDEVICPTVTFVATVNTILQAGLTPRFSDSSIYGLNVENMRHCIFLEEHNYKRVRAICPVHIAGRQSNMKEIMALAREFDLKVIEDSCETMGVDGIGLGDVTCFSFYMAHILTTGVGGMAITQDEELKNLMWSYANHGRRAAKGFIFDRIGYSSRPTEFEAVLGLCQLPLLRQIIEQRRSNFNYLCEGLYPIKGLSVHYSWSDNMFPRLESSCMFFPIKINPYLTKVKKWELMDHLTVNGIENRELLPITNQPCYKDLIQRGHPPTVQDGWTYPSAEDTNENGFYIGCHQDLTKETMDRTIEIFKAYFGGMNAETKVAEKAEAAK